MTLNNVKGSEWAYVRNPVIKSTISLYCSIKLIAGLLNSGASILNAERPH